MGQVWYLIVSIPDLCTLTYFAMKSYIWRFFRWGPEPLPPPLWIRAWNIEKMKSLISRQVSWKLRKHILFIQDTNQTAEVERIARIKTNGFSRCKLCSNNCVITINVEESYWLIGSMTYMYLVFQCLVLDQPPFQSVR